MWVCVYAPDTFFFFFFKQKTAYEMRISDWSSDVCSSDLSVLPATESTGVSTSVTPRSAKNARIAAFNRARRRIASNDAEGCQEALKIGREHVGTPVTNAHLVCRPLLEKQKHITAKQTESTKNSPRHRER